MAPNWLRVVISWLGRRHFQRKSTPPPGPRRRASFPVYGGGKNGGAKQMSAANAFVPAGAHPPSAGTYAPPPGYVYQTTQGWVGGRRVAVSSASAYPGHFVAPQPQPGPTPHQTTQADSYGRRRSHSTSAAKGGQVNYVAAPPPPGVVLPHQSERYYTFPRQRNPNTNTNNMMSQVPNAPVTISKGNNVSHSSSRPPLRPLQPESHPVQAAPPPPSSRRAARMTRAASAPGGTMPFNASPKRVNDAYTRYVDFFQRGASSFRSIAFTSIPWPVVDAPKHPTSLTVNSVRSFLLSPHHSQGVPARQRVETAQAMWDPESFMTMFGSRIKTKEERDVVDRALHFLQGTLRILHAEVVAAESLSMDLVGSP